MLFGFIWIHIKRQGGETMKVYMYFLIDKKLIQKMSDTYLLESLDHFSEPGLEDYFFYAFTTKKKVAKKFEAMRDMSKFFKRVQDMDEEDYKELENRFFRFSALSFQPLLCGEHQHAVIPLTTGEYWYCVEARAESVNQMLQLMPKIPPEIFEGEMFEALSQLGILDILSDSSMYAPEGDEVYDYIRNNGWKNELAIFLWLYGDLVEDANVIGEAYYE